MVEMFFSISFDSGTTNVYSRSSCDVKAVPVGSATFLLNINLTIHCKITKISRLPRSTYHDSLCLLHTYISVKQVITSITLNSMRNGNNLK